MKRWRSWSLFLGLSFGAAACTKANPAYHCQNSTCIDPAFPYCDADGSIGGTAGVCIAVACTTGEFGKCSNDSALTCNDTGTGYVETQCAHGCDEGTGCKLCEANQTVCSNGTVATCDASGGQTSAIQCPLGCFEDQPRCTDVEPSNHLGPYYDMIAAPKDLDLKFGTLDLLSGQYTSADVADFGAVSNPDSFVVPSLAGGPPIRVVVVNNLTLGTVVLRGPTDGSTMATAFLASGDILVNGTVSTIAGAGQTTDVSCQGHQGRQSYEQNDACIYVGGGGGGGAAAGSVGGRVIDLDSALPLAGGPVYGTDDLQPLVGGCAGGGFHNYASGDNTLKGSNGGGAIQLTSRTAITVNGTIKMDGDPGYADDFGNQLFCGQSQFGGGGGGGILIEAPVVTLAAHSTLSAAGGNGAGCDPATQTCGLPGHGGGATAATPGGDVTWTTALGSTATFASGTGAGGAGRVRVNTATSTYTLDATAVRNAIVTNGAIKIR